MILGCHVQMKAPDYVLGSVREALSYGCDAMMLYTGAPQNTKRKALADMKIGEARQLMKERGIPMDRMIIHAPYLINPANSVKPEVADLAVTFLQEEVKRTAGIGAKYIVLHPGSFTTTDQVTGIRTAAAQLNRLGSLPANTVICLETMAGKGTEIGRSFEELAEILSALEHPECYGVCLDTCHIHDAGYDMNDFDGVLDRFDQVIGLSRLHVIHLNDSKNIRGAGKDRHANIGCGEIGFEALLAAAENRRTADIPKILETPYINGKPEYAREIAMLRNRKFEDILNEKNES
ncbi:MAG: deoxyribonuclease IV [Solobacterium sp.]|nr:deoxyribonuclease IV [Solobacterium sp.]